MTAKQILKELKALGNENTKKILLRHGAREPVFGVKVADLKQLLKKHKLKVDYQLALDLYATGNFDAMYLAGLIADDEKMTKKDLKTWAKLAYGGWLPTFVVPWAASGNKHGWALALEWIESKQELIAATGWWTICSMMSIKPDEKLDLPALKKLLKRVEKEIQTERNYVKDSMNDYVVALGSFVSGMKDIAIKAGEKIGPVMVDKGETACGTPFSPDYIRKVESKGRLGKKRKSARC